MDVIKRLFSFIVSANLSLVISVLALVVSFGQLIASVPMLTDFYNKPKLLLEGTSSRVRSDISLGNYTLVNSGRTSATNVEVGFNTRIGDKVVVMPSVAHKVITDKDPVFIDHARLEFSRILPDERIVIMIVGKGNEPLPDVIVKSFEGTGFDMSPSASYLRSDQGSGVIIQKPIDNEKQASPADNKSQS